MDWAIKHNELGFYLKEIISPSDIQDCKFMICNELSSNRNGNVSYTMDLKPLTEQKYLEIGGWKLIELNFPGNWFGQTGYCTLEDSYGERDNFWVTKQASYKDNKINMLKMALNNIEELVTKNFSIRYYNFTNKSIYTSVRNLSTLKDLIKKTQEYIEEYDDLKSKILEANSDKSSYYLQSIGESFAEGIKKYYAFDISKIEGLDKKENMQ